MILDEINYRSMDFSKDRIEAKGCAVSQIAL